VHLLLVSELYIYQNARCNDKKKLVIPFTVNCNFDRVCEIAGTIRNRL